jgi:hypothetical protein
MYAGQWCPLERIMCSMLEDHLHQGRLGEDHVGVTILVFLHW